MGVAVADYTNRTLCSVWDFVFFTSRNAMTIREIQDRFSASQATVERWRDIAISLGVEVKEVPTMSGVAYRTVRLAQGYAVVDDAITSLKRNQRQRRNEGQRRRRSQIRTSAI